MYLCDNDMLFFSNLALLYLTFLHITIYYKLFTLFLKNIYIPIMKQGCILLPKLHILLESSQTCLDPYRATTSANPE